METSMEGARVGLASAKARHGLTQAKLRELQPSERTYKFSDGGNGLYVVVSPGGSRSFRDDYRLRGRRETLPSDAMNQLPVKPFEDLLAARR